ncbi:hypothetical protein [Sansalvadorimonas verongulae]|uniref:hypothetical protein n=1 Tax=Sansalvadorimonas verongulae TaxID=2172824 RepID=UPI0012BD72A7|nr:hypothetical protein [Sansalvadorimonas verongulae]MTI11766.1 hypothetical protein [Sansalvadorimonas verongulae]
MAVHESKPDSIGNAAVKVGGAQSDLYALDIENHVYWRYKAYTYLNRFVCKAEAPAGYGSLSHSVAVCTYSE